MPVSDDAKAVVEAIANLKLVPPVELIGKAKEALEQFDLIAKDLATEPLKT